MKVTWSGRGGQDLPRLLIHKTFLEGVCSYRGGVRLRERCIHAVVVASVGRQDRRKVFMRKQIGGTERSYSVYRVFREVYTQLEKSPRRICIQDFPLPAPSEISARELKVTCS